MKALENFADELNREIDQYEKAILKLVDNDTAIDTLLQGYKAAVEDLAETYFKLRSYKDK